MVADVVPNSYTAHGSCFMVIYQRLAFAFPYIFIHSRQRFTPDAISVLWLVPLAHHRRGHRPGPACPRTHEGPTVPPYTTGAYMKEDRRGDQPLLPAQVPVLSSAFLSLPLPVASTPRSQTTQC